MIPRAICSTLLLLPAFLSAGVVLEASLHDPLAPTFPADAEAIIRSTYDTVEKYTRKSTGPDFSVEVRSFRTIPAGEFDSLRMQDIVTLPAETTLRVEPMTMLNTATGRRGAQYRVWWQTQEEPESHRAWRERLDKMTLRKAFAEAAANAGASEAENWRHVMAATTYTVDVRFDGTERTYQAAFLWVLRPGDQAARFIVQDYVTDQVDWAIREDWPPMSEEALRRGPP
jgi:hypothetical protein